MLISVFGTLVKETKNENFILEFDYTCYNIFLLYLDFLTSIPGVSFNIFLKGFDFAVLM
jgi:hypothetical protein